MLSAAKASLAHEPEIKARTEKRAPNQFDWPLAYEAEALIRQHVECFCEKNAFAKQLAARMRAESGTDIFEWTDYLTLPFEERPKLLQVGLVAEEVAENGIGFTMSHPEATLPTIRLLENNSPSILALRPEFVADFIAAQRLASEPEGEPFSRFRRVVVAAENGTRLEAIERHAYRGFNLKALESNEVKAILKARELWFTRPRYFEKDAEGVSAANRTLDRVLELVNADVACDLFFEAERHYWENRNRAAQIQKHRQDTLGLGWGNHDHHTFRSSREHFVDLIEFLLKLGFAKRERYYAGAEAGWGAQILEQPVTGIVVFADVDLMPEETQIDFSAQRLPPAPRLGTVGLWVGLHGESFLQAGMHHLEARFEFNELREQLKNSGIITMKPFSDFEFLRQAFTEGERWVVQPERAKRLFDQKLITETQLAQFVRDGALGSHLENLQRHGGFKGFNQKSVSVVIAATDPRRNTLAKSAL